MLFKDLGKPIKDFINDDFLVSQSLRVKTKSQSGIEWTTESEILPERSVFAKINASYQGNNGISLDKLRVTSDGRVQAEATMQYSEYLKLKVSAEDGRQEPGRPLHSLGKLGFEYNISKMSVAGDLDVVNGPTLYGSAILDYYRAKFGIETSWNSHLEDRGVNPELLGVNLGLVYRGNDWKGCIKTADLVGKLNVSYVHHVSNVLDISGLVCYGLRTNYQKLIFTAKYKLDDTSAVKFKIDSNAKVSASFQQQLSPVARLVLSTELHAIAKEGTVDSGKVGVGLFIE